MKFEVTFEIEKDDQMIVLTTEEARDLYNKLKQHFGDDPPMYPIIYPQPPQPPYIPWTAPSNPWSAPGTSTPYPPEPWTITCSYGNAVTVNSNN